MTRPLALSPFYHPTTAVLVDDNETFVRSLTLEMPPGMALRAFTSPEEALAFLNEPPALAPLVDRCFTLDHGRHSEAIIHLDLGIIEQEINHLQRFRRVSVVLVDYAMPSMNGLEFCERLQDPCTRRAMLTGVADEKRAVAAFNSGLIHRFIAKHEATDVDDVVGFIRQLEREYFNQHLARLRTALSINPPALLADPDIAARVQAIIREERIAEYYLVDEPPGFLMLRADGSVIRLALLDPQARREQLELVRLHGAPPAVRAGLENGTLVGLFGGADPSDFFGEEPYPWEEHLAPARPVAGARGWVEAVIHDAATDIDFDPARSSHEAYLARFAPP